MTTRTEPYRFPPLEEATVDGLLAIGGDLSSERLLAAYRKGIFPGITPANPYSGGHPTPGQYFIPADSGSVAVCEKLSAIAIFTSRLTKRLTACL